MASPTAAITLAFLFLSLFNAPTARAQDFSLHYIILEEVPTNTFIADLSYDPSLHSLMGREEVVTFRANENSTGYPYLLLTDAGGLYTHRSLDREELCGSSPECSITLRVLARAQQDQVVKTIDVTVHVVDVNDNSPVFPTEVVHLQIAENEAVGTLFQIPTAYDADAGAVLDYWLMNNFPFTLQTQPADSDTEGLGQGSSGLWLRLTARIDREYVKSIQLRVTASDNGHPMLVGHLTIDVQVLDVNDNAPLFTQIRYEFQVPENAEGIVGRVLAMDADMGRNAEVSYQLAVGARVPFNVMPDGRIMTNGSLDYETADRYEFRVLARDNGSVPLTSTASVIVHVTNVVTGDVTDDATDDEVEDVTDDKSEDWPEFDFPSPGNNTLTIHRDLAINGTVGTLTAHTRNPEDQVVFAIPSRYNVANEFFDVTEDGRVFQVKALPDDVDNIRLNVDFQVFKLKALPDGVDTFRLNVVAHIAGCSTSCLSSFAVLYLYED